MDLIVCVGSSCHLKGARNIIQSFERLIDAYNLQERVTLKGSFCMGNCVSGVSVKFDDKIYSVSPLETEKFFKEHIVGRLSA